MAGVRNLLFIMCDQLRADYLGCAGHKTLKTPNIDRLAAMGVRFTRAYCQAPVCGPSRMSFYTGRYVSGHGATYNGVPLPVGIPTMGDHLRPLGLRTAVVGKTHVAPDTRGMERLGLGTGREAQLFSQAGFEPYARDDGLYPETGSRVQSPFNDYLRSLGYEADNPWHDYANSALDSDGKEVSGWHLRNAGLPARVDPEHSETAFTTDRALDFITECRERPWCLHLSYIKPHWPYMAPAPFHALYGADDVQPVRASERELESPNPVYAAFAALPFSHEFSKPRTRRRVIPTYMGLIAEIDHHLGRLWSRLEASGRLEDTMIVFTSDHGDYLGDHWLGEKDLFHEQSVRVPLIIYDPDPAAGPTRATHDDRLVEAIDLLPTFVDALGGTPEPHLLDGQSLLPVLRGSADAPRRDAVVSEGDFSFSAARHALGLAPHEARGIMIRTATHKYVDFGKSGSQLFDLDDDPMELNDRSGDQSYERVRREMAGRLFEWLRARRIQRQLSDDEVEARTGKDREHGFLIGVW